MIRYSKWIPLAICRRKEMLKVMIGKWNWRKNQEIFDLFELESTNLNRFTSKKSIGASQMISCNLVWILETARISRIRVTRPGESWRCTIVNFKAGFDYQIHVQMIMKRVCKDGRKSVAVSTIFFGSGSMNSSNIYASQIRDDLDALHTRPLRG